MPDNAINQGIIAGGEKDNRQSVRRTPLEQSAIGRKKNRNFVGQDLVIIHGSTPVSFCGLQYMDYHSFEQFLESLQVCKVGSRQGFIILILCFQEKNPVVLRVFL